jgi:hypothetical protein
MIVIRNRAEVMTFADKGKRQGLFFSMWRSSQATTRIDRRCGPGLPRTAKMRMAAFGARSREERDGIPRKRWRKVSGAAEACLNRRDGRTISLGAVLRILSY